MPHGSPSGYGFGGLVPMRDEARDDAESLDMFSSRASPRLKMPATLARRDRREVHALRSCVRWERTSSANPHGLARGYKSVVNVGL